jgi:hypothetical protein
MLQLPSSGSLCCWHLRCCGPADARTEARACSRRRRGDWKAYTAQSLLDHSLDCGCRDSNAGRHWRGSAWPLWRVGAGRPIRPPRRGLLGLAAELLALHTHSRQRCSASEPQMPAARRHALEHSKGMPPMGIRALRHLPVQLTPDRGSHVGLACRRDALKPAKIVVSRHCKARRGTLGPPNHSDCVRLHSVVFRDETAAQLFRDLFASLSVACHVYSACMHACLSVSAPVVGSSRVPMSMLRNRLGPPR